MRKLKIILFFGLLLVIFSPAISLAQSATLNLPTNKCQYLCNDLSRYKDSQSFCSGNGQGIPTADDLKANPLPCGSSANKCGASSVAVCCCGNGLITSGSTTVAPKEPLFIMPTFEVNIPTVKLSSSTCKLDSDNTYHCSFPWIGEYISGIYKYGINIAGILAAIVLMGGGLLWLISGGDASKITQAKNMIIGSITGLVILMSSYVLLFQINPDLVKMKSIGMGVIDKVYEDENWGTPGTGQTGKIGQTAPQSSSRYCGCISWKDLYATSNLKTADSIKTKLTGTPLANYSESVAQLCQQYNIDPALVLAIWEIDSIYGTSGSGKTNNNPGNVTCGGQSSGTGWTCNGRFRKYDNFNVAITDWFNVVANGKRLSSSKTIRELIQTYAPPFENDTQSYINRVMGKIDSAHNGSLKNTDGSSESLQKCSDINKGCN